MEDLIKTHVRWQNCELYSVGKRHYFGLNGTLYILPETLLVKILEEISEMNPSQSVGYLIEQATDKNRFNLINL